MTRKKVTEMDRDELSSIVSYDPEAGKFTWARSDRRAVAGSEAGSVNSRGYRYIQVNGQKVRANRLAWFMSYGVWPELHVDHINGDSQDDRLCNLRLATNAQNTFNGRLNSNNSVGVKGVTLRKESGRYRAYITRDKRIWLGTFETIEEAEAARFAAEIHYHGEFAASKRRLVPEAGQGGGE